MGAMTRIVSPGSSTIVGVGIDVHARRRPWCMTMLIRLSAWISPTVRPTSRPVGADRQVGEVDVLAGELEAW